MPLTFCQEGEENTIKRIGGKEATKRHLENLGFVPGGTVKIISETNGNIIVNIKNCRVAVSKETAAKIIV